MKNKYILPVIILLITFAASVNPLSAQKRYKHVPRVKVDKTYNKEVKEQSATSTPVTQEIIVSENISAPETQTVAEESYVVEKTKEVKPVHVKKKSVVTKPVAKKSFLQKDIERYTEKLKTNSKLFNVKDVEKTKIIGFIIWFIVVIILAAILLAVAFVLLGAISYSLWYIFLVVGAVALVIAIILLILGLI